MKTNGFSFLCLLVCAVLLIGVPQTAGQAVSGNIIGTVIDPAGAVVVGAKVTIKAVDRGTAYSTTTNESGNFSQTHLNSGLYSIEFEAPGFQRIVKNDVLVSVDRSTRVDAELVVGNVTEQINVSSQAQALVTDRAEVSTELSTKQVRDLPI